MERVFQTLSLSFGNQWLAKWQGIDIGLVYDEWADVLNDSTLGAIKFAQDSCREMDRPPSLGEFKAKCRDYVPPPVQKLERKFTPEELAKNRAKIQAIINGLSKKVRG